MYSLINTHKIKKNRESITFKVNPSMVCGKGYPPAYRRVQSRWLVAAMLAACCCVSPSSVEAGSAFLTPHDVEVQIVSPRPGVHLTGGAVPLQVRLAGRAGTDTPPAGWALSISLDEDGESMVVPGVVIDGELPALPAGQHSITIALIDNEAGGALIGPRAKVRFTIGIAPQPPEIIIEAPAAALRRRATAADAAAAMVHITQLDSLEGAGWTGKVAINGFDISSAGQWQPAADGGGLEWRSHLGSLPDGLHVLDAELVDPSGAIFSRDRRYFELLTINASHPRGGIEFAADGEDCCEALAGGRDFVASPIAAAITHDAFTNPDAAFIAREAREVLEEWCKVRSCGVLLVTARIRIYIYTHIYMHFYKCTYIHIRT